MTFVLIDSTNGNSRFTSKLQQAVDLLDRTHAAFQEIDGEMQEMTAEQIGQLYGVPTAATAVKNYVHDGFGVLDTDEHLIALRTQIG